MLLKWNLIAATRNDPVSVLVYQWFLFWDICFFPFLQEQDLFLVIKSMVCHPLPRLVSFRRSSKGVGGAMCRASKAVAAWRFCVVKLLMSAFCFKPLNIDISSAMFGVAGGARHVHV